MDTRLLVQANSGGGKSWALWRFLEQTHGQVQHHVIDPEGEFATHAADLPHRRRVLLGAKVAAAHGRAFRPFTRENVGTLGTWLVWPHPSGRCRLWTPEAIERARAQMKELAEATAVTPG